MTRPAGTTCGAGSPSNTSETRTKVAASRVIQPTVSEPGACGSIPARLTRPWVVRIPYSPQKLDGTRTEPPVSVPSAASHSPCATAEAEPEDEPPGTRSGARGFSGVPSKAFSPSRPREISSVTVLPVRSAPASSSAATAQAWAVGAGWVAAQSGLPPPVT